METWVDNTLDALLNNKEPEIQITFKGKATTDSFEIALLDSGWQDGFDYCMEYWTEAGEGFETFPEFMKHQHGFYWNGWAEGVFSGIMRHLDRLYPGAKSLSYNQKTKKYDAKY